MEVLANRDFYTILEIRALEENAFALGKTVTELMEKAGQALFEEIIKIKEVTKETPLLFFVGYGNNGGDALVAARYLKRAGYNCLMYLVGNKDKFNSYSSQKNFIKLKEMIQEQQWYKIRSVEDFSNIKGAIPLDGWVIDGLLGIGIKGELREPIKSVIDFINSKFSGKVISVDIASGYNPVVKNENFIKKPYKIVCSGKSKVRKRDFPDTKIVVKDIGIPSEAEDYVGIGDVKWFLPSRAGDTHKGQNGVIVIIGGSSDYIGAPVLASLGAFRTGADLIYLLTPSDIRPIVASFSPDLITVPGNPGELTKKDVETLLQNKRTEDAVIIIGPGMKRSPNTLEALKAVLSTKSKRKIIIDAGALSSLTENELSLLKDHSVIITPHIGEFIHLFGNMEENSLEQKISSVKEVAKKWNVTVLLKGQIDIISDGNVVKLNKTGHQGMTVGGTGDTLTGIIAAIFAVVDSPVVAASLGAYISGKAGEFVAKEYGNGLMASDIPLYINKVIKQAKEFTPKEE